MRKHNWQRLMTEYIMSHRDDLRKGELIFSYDSTDPRAVNCMSFACAHAQLITGDDSDYTDGIIGYTNMTGAIRRVRELAGKEDGTMGDALANFFPEKSCAFVHRGDIVCLPSDDPIFTEALGIADPPWVWVFHHTGEIVMVPLGYATRAFAVHSNPIDDPVTDDLEPDDENDGPPIEESTS